MKTFQNYLRMRENFGNPMGLTPGDTGLRPKDDKPMDRDTESHIAKLVQVAKVSCHKHPELMVQLLGRVAERDEEVKAALDAIKNDTQGQGVRAFRDKGLGHMGTDRFDQVMPNSPDSSSGDDYDG